MKRAWLTKTILTLSWISLLSDVASEMLYPVLPIYLAGIGFSAGYIGLLEGLAEATVGISKAWFGGLSDHMQQRIPFIRFGYFLSALSKSAMALFRWLPWVFLTRAADRLGKGIRTGARDALLADESEASHRGKVFGFHRGMDTLGAALGPALALLYLLWRPGDYRTLFFIAFLPGMTGVLLTFRLREKKASAASPPVPDKKRLVPVYWRKAGPAYRSVVRGLLAFALVNSSDVFLILVARHNGLSDTAVIGAYIFYNLVYATAAFPAGMLADRLGPRRMFLAGLACFALTYAGIAFVHTTVALLSVFFLYGLFAAATEGVSKAWISLLCPPGERALALGFYSGTVSLAALFASTAGGLLWTFVSPVALFLFSAGGAAAVSLYFLLQRPVPETAK